MHGGKAEMLWMYSEGAFGLMLVDDTCLFYSWSLNEALVHWESCEACNLCGSVETRNTSLRNFIDKNLVKLSLYGLIFKVHDLLVDYEVGDW
jgi:hypothetical protein